MRILVVFCHPSRDSFCGLVLTTLLDQFILQDHEPEVLDLYAEGFNPVLSASDWTRYEGPVAQEIRRYANQLRRSEGLVWIFPTWNYGMPAILKGYVDRVWKPNVAFRLDSARNVRFDMFGNLKFFIVATTYGASRLANAFVGDPGKRVIVCGLRRHIPASSRFYWLALYGMDKASPRGMERFLAKVRSTVRASVTPFTE